MKGKGKQTKPDKVNPYCLYCGGDHWGEDCGDFNTLEKRRNFFREKRLCFNCGREGHRKGECRSRACFKCKARHHTSLCDRQPINEGSNDGVFTGEVTARHSPTKDTGSHLVGLPRHRVQKKRQRGNREVKTETIGPFVMQLCHDLRGKETIDAHI